MFGLKVSGFQTVELMCTKPVTGVCLHALAPCGYVVTGVKHRADGFGDQGMTRTSRGTRSVAIGIASAIEYIIAKALIF